MLGGGPPPPPAPSDTHTVPGSRGVRQETAAAALHGEAAETGQRMFGASSSCWLIGSEEGGHHGCVRWPGMASRGTGGESHTEREPWALRAGSVEAAVEAAVEASLTAALEGGSGNTVTRTGRK